MKNKNYTWVVRNDKGEVINKVSYQTGKIGKAIYYGKLEEIVNLISHKEWLEMATLEIYNNGFDKVNHRPITKEQLEKYFI